MEIVSWSAVETAAAIRDRKASVAEVTRAHLDRVGQCEPGLRAVVEVLADEAVAQARAMDADRPDDLPPLWGLPVTMKINVDTKGYPNSNGIPALNKEPAGEDSPVTENFRKAGAVIIGRTSTPEFSLRFFTSNPIYGRTLNPWDKGLTSGGSSGGASAAVAAGMGVLGHGNDLGGSLRYPAYCCGLATLRPSLGRVPAFNPSAPAERPATMQMMSVQGAIARTIDDIRLTMPALCARDTRDPLWNAAADCGRAHGQRLRIGVAVDPFGDGVHPGVAQSVEIAVGAVRAVGHEVVAVAPPLVHEAAETWGQLLNAEAEVALGKAIREMGSPEVQRVIFGFAEMFGVPDLEGFIAAQARRMTIQRAWAGMFEGIDALIMPVSEQPPFRADQDIVEPDTLPDILRAQRPMFILNLLGLPAAVVRTGPVAGVPLGVQIVGAWRDDDLCLDLAAAIERELALDLRPVDPV